MGNNKKRFEEMAAALTSDKKRARGRGRPSVISEMVLMHAWILIERKRAKNPKLSVRKACDYVVKDAEDNNAPVLWMGRAENFADGTQEIITHEWSRNTENLRDLYKDAVTRMESNERFRDKAEYFLAAYVEADRTGDDPATVFERLIDSRID